jgi:hypothetical protein
MQRYESHKTKAVMSMYVDEPLAKVALRKVVWIV